MNRQKGFTLIELLVVVAIIGILSGIAFVSIQGTRESAFDTQIRSELSQIRSNAEQYYYSEGEGTYHDYHKYSGWIAIEAALPGCSVSIQRNHPDHLTTSLASVATDPDFPYGEDGDPNYEVTETYQLMIEDGNDEYAQSYAAWAPLCAEEHDDATENLVFYCVDSDGNAGEFWMDSNLDMVDTAASNCLEVFEEEL